MDRLECDEVEAIAWVKQQGVDIAPSTRSLRTLTGRSTARCCSGCSAGRPRRRSRRNTGTRTRRSSGPGSTASIRSPTASTSGTTSTGPILIPEGEKHVDRLTELGFVATCNPMGAGKWRACYNEYFRSADVVILPDNDRAGPRPRPSGSRGAAAGRRLGARARAGRPARERRRARLAGQRRHRRRRCPS